MKVLGIIIFLSIIINSFASNYNLRIIKAQNLIIEGRLDSALIFYKKSFKDVKKPFPKDILNAGILAYELDSLELMKSYVIKSIEVGGFFKNTKKIFRKKIKDKLFWEKLYSLYKIQKEQKEKLLYYIQIKKILDNDQKARRGLFQKKKMQIADSVNRIKILVLLKKEGYLGYLTIGLFESFDMMAILLRHIPIDGYNKIIKTALTERELSPWYAYFIYTRQYLFETGSCPITKPRIFNEIYKHYEGLLYEKVKEKGYNFNAFI